LQTREYTDKDGNQRKATEVVLQKFRGELTLLDSRNAGRGGEESPMRRVSAAISGGNRRWSALPPSAARAKLRRPRVERNRRRYSFRQGIAGRGVFSVRFARPLDDFMSALGSLC